MRRVYKYQTTSVGGFVQQLAVGYVGRGYWHYVTGTIPERKDVLAVDEKLITRYGVGVSKWARARRKVSGGANVQYIRHGRFFVLLATYGEHRFYQDEAGSLRDVRKSPIRFGGYAIGCKAGHPSVRIDREAYKRLKARFVKVATKRSVGSLEANFRRLPFEPYAPIRGQLLAILRAVNRLGTSWAWSPSPRLAFASSGESTGRSSNAAWGSCGLLSIGYTPTNLPALL